MKTITYALPATVGAHSVSIHDEATILAVVYDGATLLLLAEADTTHATNPITFAVVRPDASGVTTPPGRVYIGSAPIGIVGTVAAVYR